MAARGRRGGADRRSRIAVPLRLCCRQIHESRQSSAGTEREQRRGALTAASSRCHVWQREPDCFYPGGGAAGVAVRVEEGALTAGAANHSRRGLSRPALAQESKRAAEASTDGT